ncbi:MAG: ATP-binding cassette domain-containing protein [Clostridia bacterium]|nr:ATP-binding cassette domain-containing protein [Clostridia bacterium]
MIEVKHLTKRYGQHEAISDLNFKIEPGHIYGFLGPNGAGKSTTMNIIAGCLAPSAGTVAIDGHDIFDEPIPAKKLIGYLPEQPPLYQDMTPREYLSFVLQAKGVKKDEAARQTDYIKDVTGIADVWNRLIRNLSKGYRQRVGLAQALAGNPKVIILDEPTVGLDPAQIIEMRDLIRELGKTHTVLLSSHILSEISAVCDQVMIISKGSLVASDTPENLSHMMSGGSKLDITVKGEKDAAMRAFEKMEAEIEYKPRGEYTQVILTGQGDAREKAFWICCEEKLPIIEMKFEQASLEDVFLELTSTSEVSDK